MLKSSASDSIRDLDTAAEGGQLYSLNHLTPAGQSTPGWANPITGLKVLDKRNIVPYWNPPIQYTVYVPGALSLGIRLPEHKTEAPSPVYSPTDPCSCLVTTSNT
jgi:hypothetical protein